MNKCDAVTVVTAISGLSHKECKNSVTVPPYTIVTDEEQIVTVLQDLTQSGAVALDIETYDPNARITKAGKRMRSATTTVCDR